MGQCFESIRNTTRFDKQTKTILVSCEGKIETRRERYSEGSHKTLSPLQIIQERSSLSLYPYLLGEWVELLGTDTVASTGPIEKVPASVYRQFESGILNSTKLIEPVERIDTFSPVAGSQIRIVLFWDLDTNWFPSGDQIIDRIKSLYLSRISILWSVSGFQIRTVLSRDSDINRFLSGDQTTDSIKSVYSSKENIFWPVSGFQIRIVISKNYNTNWFLSGNQTIDLIDLLYLSRIDIFLTVDRFQIRTVLL